MASRKRYDLDRVAVESREQRSATWTFPGKVGRDTVSGTDYIYSVIDENLGGHYLWEFVVRVPAARNGQVEVRPLTAPQLKAWAELPRRSVMFPLAKLGDARGKRYCKVWLAQPQSGRVRPDTRTKTGVRWDQRDALPRWFESLRSRMRKKERVNATKGSDGDSLVILVSADDHAAMIRLYFAMKVWVLKERVVLA
jgi:hypothetical protein